MNIMDIKKEVEMGNISFKVDGYKNGLLCSPFIYAKDNSTGEEVKVTFLEDENFNRTKVYDEKDFTEEEKKNLKIVIALNYNGRKVYFKNLRADGRYLSKIHKVFIKNRDGEVNFVTNVDEAIIYSHSCGWLNGQVDSIKRTLDRGLGFNRGLSDVHLEYIV